MVHDFTINKTAMYRRYGLVDNGCVCVFAILSMYVNHMCSARIRHGWIEPFIRQNRRWLIL